MYEQIEETLLNNHYNKIDFSKDPGGLRMYMDATVSYANVILLADMESTGHEDISQIRSSFKVESNFGSIGVHFFTLCLIDSTKDVSGLQLKEAKEACGETKFAWVYDIGKKSLMIFEGQAEDFYGLKGLLENMWSFEYIENPSYEIEKVNYLSNLKDGIKKLPKATAAIVFINVAVFVLCTFSGNLLYNKGAVGLSLLTSPTQWYRIITSLFLHADAAHIFGNMVLLYFLGDIVEKEIKPLYFLLVYFLSGITGCVFTFINEYITGKSVIMIGASGAVFGLLGVLLALVIFKRIKKSTMPIGRVLVVTVFTLFEGFGRADTANFAHLGGLCAGFVFGIIYCLINRNSAKS